MRSDSEISVVEVRDLASLGRYRRAWDDLLAVTPGASFFQTYDWFVTRVANARDGVEPRVLIVGDEQSPLGILPLILSTKRRRLISFRILGFPLADWGAIYGPIGPDPAPVLAGGLTHLRSASRDWDVLDFCWVDPDHADGGETQRAMSACGLTPRKAFNAHTAQVELAGTWNDYWSARKSHFRTNLRRNEKRLAEQGTVRHFRYRPAGAAHDDADPRWDLFDTCVALAARTWQAGSTSGTTMSHATIEPLLRKLHEVAVHRGAVDVNLLTLDERPIAFAYNYHYCGYVYGVRMGFDPASSGAGSVLLVRAIEDSFRRGDRIYDLGPEYLACKRHWWTRLVPTYRYTYYPPISPLAQLVRFARWCKSPLASTK
jgi:CelD/BcsL family acetyltransferase involved in cellulose biosynthesis